MTVGARRRAVGGGVPSWPQQTRRRLHYRAFHRGGPVSRTAAAFSVVVLFTLVEISAGPSPARQLLTSSSSSVRALLLLPPPPLQPSLCLPSARERERVVAGAGGGRLAVLQHHEKVVEWQSDIPAVGKVGTVDAAHEDQLVAGPAERKQERVLREGEISKICTIVLIFVHSIYEIFENIGTNILK